MRTLLLSIVFILFTAFIHAQEKAHFYLQGEIGLLGGGVNVTDVMRDCHIPSHCSSPEYVSYRGGNLILTPGIEMGVKNNFFMIGLGSELLTNIEAPVSSYIKVGCNYFKNKNFFLGNYVAIGVYYREHYISPDYYSINSIYSYPYVKTGLYFSRKSLVVTLNIRKYYVSTGYLFNVFSIDLGVGYRFDFGKHKNKDV